jgi:antitoxin HigA-1
MSQNRKPTTPGEILNEEFLGPLGMTQKQLADHIGCDVKAINRIVNDRTILTTEMALKLGSALQTTADFWLNAQKAVNLYQARKNMGTLPKPIKRAA